MDIESDEWRQIVRFAKDQIRRSPELIDERRFLWPSGYDEARALQADPCSMVESARTDRIAFDKLRAAIAWLSDRSQPLPKPAQDWLVQYLRDQVEIPKATDGRTLTQLGKELLIWSTVSHIVNETKLKATRAESSPAHSACDAMAEALEESDLSPTDGISVMKIWKRRPHEWRR